MANYLAQYHTSQTLCTYHLKCKLPYGITGGEKIRGEGDHGSKVRIPVAIMMISQWSQLSNLLQTLYEVSNFSSSNWETGATSKVCII